MKTVTKMTLGVATLGLVLVGSPAHATQRTIGVTASIANVSTGLCADNFGRGNNGHVVQFTCNGGTYQSWALYPLSATSTVYDVVNRQSGLCLDVQAATTADGAHIAQYTCNGNANQHWTLVPSEVGLRLQPQHAVSRCLKASGGSGSDLWQQVCLTASLTQGWYLK